MRTQSELNGLSHEEVTICECDDIHCTCGGACRLESEYTMYTMDERGNIHPESSAGVSMCSDCAFHAWEGGYMVSDDPADHLQ